MKFVHTVKVGISVYRYYRRPGRPPTRLHAEPGTPEAVAEYERIAQIGEHDPRRLSPEERWATFVDGGGRSLGLAAEKAARGRARRTGRPYTLNEGWMEAQFFRQRGLCAVSGIPMVKDRPKLAPYAPSIDRIESARGYTPSNVRLVCYLVNCGLNMFGDADFYDVCEAVYLGRVKRLSRSVK